MNNKIITLYGLSVAYLHKFLVFALLLWASRVQAIAPKDSIEICKLTEKWLKAENARDLEAFDDLYAGSLWFYKVIDMSKEKCLQEKKKIFSRYKEYKVTMLGAPHIEPQGYEHMVTFTKRVVYDGNTRDFEAVLRCRKNYKDEWKIEGESDTYTDSVELARRLERESGAHRWKGAMAGDFNGDGKTETATMIAAAIDTVNDECIGPCRVVIHFSDKAVPDLVIEDALTGVPENLGDLDDKKGQEIGFYPFWFQGNWACYRVYTLRNNKWVYLIPPCYSFCALIEGDDVPVEKDKKHPSYLLQRYYGFDKEYGNIIRKVKRVKPLR